MRVAVDVDVCTGHGRCYALAPEVFGADDFGHCELLVADGVVPAALEDQARLGRDNCPEQAISISE
ncbi:MAG: ferredoxin [Acidimicrobiia bacterium]